VSGENGPMNVAMAIGAHPDDIEFGMAGTLLMLGRVGWEIHYLNLANGSCGSRRHRAAELVVRRRREARAAAQLLGAHWHPGWVNDLEILYELKTLRRVAAVLRDVRPAIILTHSPEDYMEDHTHTCRLVVTAAFSLGMANFRTIPSRPAIDMEVALYHALPHGLRNGLRRRIVPGAFVNTTPVHSRKLAALAEHTSQQDWLEASQGMNSYLKTMDARSREVGRLSRRFTHAEGWCRHCHLGYSAVAIDPLAGALGRDHLVNRRYESSLG
jgi:N-acetylglucosamine malate deacetylase 1